MADNSPYTPLGVNINLLDGDHLGDSFVQESMVRVFRYGVPYRIYRDAFISADDDRSAEECSNILSSLVEAALWGAANARMVLTERQIEDSEHQECALDFEGDE